MSQSARAQALIASAVAVLAVAFSAGANDAGAQVLPPAPPRPPNAYYYADDYSHKVLPFIKVRDSVKLVVVGDSRGDFAVDPHAFYAGDHQDGVCAFNFASCGTGFECHEIILADYVPHAPNLKWIVYEMSPRLFNKYMRDKGAGTLQRSGGLRYDLQYAARIWGNPPPATVPGDLWGWPHSYQTTFPTGNQPAGLGEYGKYILDTSRWARFEKLLDFYEKRGVKVLGYIPPMPPLYADRPCVDKDGTPRAAYWALVESLTELRLKHPNFYFRDLHLGGRHGLPMSDFIDWDHMNGNGARWLSPILEGMRKAIDAQPKLDVTPPAVFSVTAVGDPSRVVIYFTKPVVEAEAVTAPNYEIGSGVTAQSARLAEDLRTVTLTTSPLAENVKYSLTVKNVKDRFDNVSAETPAPFTFVKNFEVGATEPAKYVWTKLSVGAQPYSDSPATLTAIPPRYAALTALKTAEAGKAATGDSFISFETNYPVRVYVAHDENVQIKPAWMSSFIYTWDFVEMGKDKFRIAWKDFPAGKVTLGGNAGADGHMYMVFVEPMGSVIASYNPGEPVHPGSEGRPAGSGS